MFPAENTQKFPLKSNFCPNSIQSLELFNLIKSCRFKSTLSNSALFIIQYGQFYYGSL